MLNCQRVYDKELKYWCLMYIYIHRTDTSVNVYNCKCGTQTYARRCMFHTIAHAPAWSLRVCIVTSIWVNYNDLTATSLESWLRREIIPKDHIKLVSCIPVYIRIRSWFFLVEQFTVKPKPVFSLNFHDFSNQNCRLNLNFNIKLRNCWRNRRNIGLKNGTSLEDTKLLSLILWLFNIAMDNHHS